MNVVMTRLTDAERLSMQQLRLLEWAERRSPLHNLEAREAGEDLAADRLSFPERWELTRGLALARWQEDACEAWFAARQRGTIKGVTGAGKTVVALAIAERLQRDDSALRVAVVVPTIVLMNQWYETFKTRSNLPEAALGRRGGDADDSAAHGPLTSQLRQEIGPLVYEMTFAEAIRLGVLPPFEVRHFGLPLSPDEARRYQALTRAINDARRELLATSPSARRAGG